ncbi:MAG: hypothetical protein AAGL29_00830 [Bacteroidota bacterium]
MFKHNRTRFHYIGMFFLLLQVLGVCYARFVPERFFAWAPYDEQTHYHIQVVVDGKPLSDEAVTKRYRVASKRVESRTIHNIFNIIEQYESTYGLSDKAKVIVRYNTNGKGEKLWQYPQE